MEGVVFLRTVVWLEAQALLHGAQVREWSTVGRRGVLPSSGGAECLSTTLRIHSCGGSWGMDTSTCSFSVSQWASLAVTVHRQQNEAGWNGKAWQTDWFGSTGESYLGYPNIWRLCRETSIPAQGGQSQEPWIVLPMEVLLNFQPPVRR